MTAQGSFVEVALESDLKNVEVAEEISRRMATTEIYTLSLHDALPICFVEVALESDLKNVEVAEEICRRMASTAG